MQILIDLFILDITASISLLTAFVIGMVERKKVDRINEIMSILEGAENEDSD